MNWSTVVVSAVALVAPCVCSGQMQIILSVYVDADSSEDFATMYPVSSTVDESIGCSNHYGYETELTVYAPDGRTANAQGDLYVSTEIPIDGVTGTYWVSSWTTGHCGCFYGVEFSAGASLPIGVGISGTSSSFSKCQVAVCTR